MMPQNWWELFPEVRPSPFTRSRPLPGTGGVIPAQAAAGIGADQVPPDPRDSTYFSGHGPAGGDLPGRAPAQPPFAGDDRGPAMDRDAVIQHAVVAMQRGADPQGGNPEPLSWDDPAPLGRTFIPKSQVGSKAVSAGQQHGIVASDPHGSQPPTRHQLGSLSESFETSGHGPGTVNRGQGDPGGPSYGSYQLATNSGQPQSFLQNEGRRWLGEFHGARPGTAAFNSVWQAIAARDPQGFAEAQHAYIERTHYSRAIDHVRAGTGLDLNSRPDAVRDAAWSVSVQHGRAPSILTQAVRATDRAVPDRRSANYDEVLINNLYDIRTAYVLRQAATNRSLTNVQRERLRSVANRRYLEERREALRRLREQ